MENKLLVYCLIFFTAFRAPYILQSDNGRAFVNKVIEVLRIMWDALKIVHGKPRYSQSQGSVEKANQNVENVLVTWLIGNKIKNQSVGLKCVQFMKNVR